MTKILAKITIFLGFTAVLFAADPKNLEKNLTDLVKARTNQDFIVKSVHSISKSPLKIAVLEDAKEKTLVPVLTDENGTALFVLTNIFFMKDDADAELVTKIIAEVQSKNSNAQNDGKLKELFAKVPSEYRVTLKSTKNPQKNIFIVTDPSCPHCQAELQNIDTRLKNGNVHLILVDFLGEKSLAKAAYILDNKNGKSDAALKKLVQEAYASKFTPKNASEASKKKVKNITQIITDTGLIHGVPFIFED